MTHDVVGYYARLAAHGHTTLPLLLRAARHLWGMRFLEALDLVQRLTASGLIVEMPTGPGSAVYAAWPLLLSGLLDSATAPPPLTGAT